LASLADKTANLQRNNRGEATTDSDLWASGALLRG
jgi:hypothetical protein